MSYLIKSLVDAVGPIRPDVKVIWAAGQTREVDDTQIEFYRANPAAFTILSGPGFVENQRAAESQPGGNRMFGDSIVLPKAAGKGIMVDPDAPTYGWRDIIGNVQPKATGLGSPARAAYAGGVLGQYAFVANDVCDFEFHIPHDYAPGTDLYFHVHWSHNGTSISGSAEFEVYYTYSKGHNQAAFPAEKTLSISYATVDLATTPQYRHRVDETAMTAASASATLTDRDDIEVDGLVLATLKLKTLPTIGGGGKLFVHTCDLHYQSTNAATKGKAPSFY